MKALTSQAGKKSVDRTRPVFSEKDKNILPQKRAREECPIEALFSDYADGNFDDLPSPSQLLSNKKLDCAVLTSSEVDVKAKHNTDPAHIVTKKHTDTPLPSISRSEPSQNHSIKFSTPKPQPGVIEIADDTPPGSRKVPITTLRECTKRSSLPLAMETDQTLKPKRKASQDENPKEVFQKRVKQNVSVLASPSPVRTSLNEGNRQSPEQPTFPMTGPGMDLTAAWDDDGIDLLDEFKDIIRFI